MPRCVEGGDGWCAASGLDTVDQHGPALGAEGGDDVCGLGEHQVQVRVMPGVGVVDQPRLDVVGGAQASRWYLCAAEPAQRHDRVDPVRQAPDGVDATEQDARGRGGGR